MWAWSVFRLRVCRSGGNASNPVLVPAQRPAHTAPSVEVTEILYAACPASPAVRTKLALVIMANKI